MKATLQQQIIDTLTAAGWVVDANARTAKYIVLIHGCRCGSVLCIGKNGAFRIGPTPSRSISLANGSASLSYAKRYAGEAQKHSMVAL